MPNDHIHISSKALFPSTAPFSHVVIANGTGHVCGIVGQRPDTGALIGPETVAQARKMFDNLETVLAEAGYGLSDIVATRLYLADYADFEVINAVYGERLSPPYPARSTLQVSLPLGARVQIDATFDTTRSE